MNMSKYDKMVECNRRVSVEKINLARITILEMVEEGERVTVPKLMVQTGLSRGFFYKNPTVRKLVDEAVEKQAGMVDPRKGILDMVMDNEIAKLHEQIRLAPLKWRRLYHSVVESLVSQAPLFVLAGWRGLQLHLAHFGWCLIGLHLPRLRLHAR